MWTTEITKSDINTFMLYSRKYCDIIIARIDISLPMPLLTFHGIRGLAEFTFYGNSWRPGNK
jgi:hypothetical protein